jgi:hypothetical protein
MCEKLKSMELTEAKQIYEIIKESNHQPLVNTLLVNAIKYTDYRVKWLIVDINEKLEIDQERTRTHNAFISSCDSLARNMHRSGEDSSWRSRIGKDRKAIGDFAVLLVAVMGLKAR